MKDKPLIKHKGPDMDTCNGCAVCTLSCPVWNQTHDLLKTFCGRMRSIQGGADIKDLTESLNACVLCGSCQPVCSYSMDTVTRTMELRSALNNNEQIDSSKYANISPAKGRVVLCTDEFFDTMEIPSRTLELLGQGASIYDDNADDISEAIETGRAVSPARVDEFISRISGASEVVTTDGLIYRFIKSRAPRANVMGLGAALIRNTSVRKNIKSDDLYIIDSRTYNADFAHLVKVYDQLRKWTDCMMNRDLHRVATPTGVTRTNKVGAHGAVDPVKQALWILEGRAAARVVVERVEDILPFKRATDIPVIHLSEIV
jgi:ferredoxin